ncbi:hypothetical protein HDE_07864 [Halotydeus destructor]|nr:hypothetical protein HDE_07864 [Halotydeus destructor]
MSYLMICYGLMEIGPQVGASIKQVLYLFTTRNAAFAAMCMISFKNVNRHLLLMYSLLALAVTTSLNPYVATLVEYHFVQAFVGISLAMCHIGINSLMVHIWKAECNRHMQIMHCWGLLGVIFGYITIKTYTFANRAIDRGSRPLTPDDKIPHIWKAYLVSSALLVFAAILQLLFHLVMPFDTDESLVEDDNMPAGRNITESLVTDYHSLPKLYVFVIVACGALSVCSVQTLEQNVGFYVMPFAMFVNSEIDQLEAFNIMKSFYRAYFITRLGSVFVAIYVKAITMLAIDVALMVGGAFMLFFCAEHSILGLRIGMQIMIIGVSSFWPAMFSFVAERVTMNDHISSLLNFFAALQLIFFPLIQGRHLQTSPMLFAYINLIGALIVMVVFVIILLAELVRKMKFKGFSLQ